jgi:hypothetical protein
MEIVRLSSVCIGGILGPDPEDGDLVRVLVFLSCGNGSLDVFERKLPPGGIAVGETLTDGEKQKYIDHLVSLAILGNQTLLSTTVPHLPDGV